ncbi:MAG: hypothetical protein R6V45_12505 [Oceanipulchritudo sp.]
MIARRSGGVEKVDFPDAIDRLKGTAFKPAEMVHGIIPDYFCVEIPDCKGVIAKNFDSLEIKAIASGESFRLGVSDFLPGIIQVPVLAMLQEIIARCGIRFKGLQVMLREALIKPFQGFLNPLDIAFLTNKDLFFLVALCMHAS